MADESTVDVGGELVWNWNVMDYGTRYNLASYLSKERSAEAATAVIKKALKAADAPPKTITTDKWRSYLQPVKKLMPDTTHVLSQGIRAEINNNRSERLQGTFRQRTKTLRGVENMETGQRYLDGWVLQYNLFREHESLGYKTPGEKARVNAPFTEWADVVRVATAAPPIDLPKRKRPRVELPKVKFASARPGRSAPFIPSGAHKGMPKGLRPKPPRPP